MDRSIIDILAMWTPGWLELIIIGIIAVLIFGKRLPEIARGMGRSLHEFKKGMKVAKDVKEDLKSEVKDSIELNEQETNNINN